MWPDCFIIDCTYEKYVDTRMNCIVSIIRKNYLPLSTYANEISIKIKMKCRITIEVTLLIRWCKEIAFHAWNFDTKGIRRAMVYKIFRKNAMIIL